ncbi:aldose epimerase family protein [Streptomyces sp. NPDC051662]|uniref:aldose epimerase family protein n=1 Tax=Streptomyces sp. NPDC051662 TaxID=3154750 RepID=UPI003420DEB2
MHAYTLGGGDGFAVTVWTYGATLVEVLAPDPEGHRANVVARLPDLAAYQDRARNPYVGATIGRYCRGISHGRFRLDGTEYRLERNDGPHHVHGGTWGMDRYVWEAEADHDGDEAVLRMRLTSPDGDQGYPGELRTEAVYRVGPDQRLTVEYRATASAPTIVGFTNHAFWNLAGAGTVDGHWLRLNARHAVVFDAQLMPLAGDPVPVVGTALDFTGHRRLNAVVLDNCYVLERHFAPLGIAPLGIAPLDVGQTGVGHTDVGQTGVGHTGVGHTGVGDDSVGRLSADGEGWVATLSDGGSGRMMRVYTDQPAVGVYSADHWAQRPRVGLCLETGPLPDAPNRSDYPSCRLDPGGLYRARTVYRFSVR